MYRITLELDRPIKRAVAWNKSTVLKRNGHRAEATVAEIHEVLTLAY
jgi:hypothetical protein